MSMKKEIFNKLTGKFILLTILLTLLSINVLAANDPGHDTLYIEQQGDSELNGTLNITSNVSVEGGRTYEGGGLTIYGNGYAETPVEAYISGTTGSHLYLDGQGNIYIKYYGGDTVYVGRTDITATDLNVSGALYTRNQAVCLANGTNCPSSLGGANITAGGATPGYIPQFQSTTVLNNSIIIQTATGIGIGTTSPTTKLDVNGSINISLSTGILYAPQICLAGTCQTSWPSGADGNNYTTGVNVSGTSTKNISLTIIGRDPVWITFTDIDTDTWITDKVGIQTDISSRMLNETVYTLVGARMMNATTYTAIGERAMNATVLSLVGARMMNGSLDLSLQGMNTTIALKASTTTVDATNTAQNNTILLEVGARAMNATLMSEVGARAMNATVMTLVGARMMNGSLDLSLQGMNTTIGLKAATTVVDATNTAQNTTIALKALTGNCPEGEYVENTTTSGVQCSAVAASSGGNISAQGPTAGYITQFQNGTIINNSIIFQNGTSVGIGTTAPNKKLHISETVAGLTYGLKLTNNSTETLNYGTGILFQAALSGGANNGKGAIAYAMINGDYSWGRGDIVFLQNSEASAANPTLSDTKMIITNAGNVGIGTYSPAAKLDVVSATSDTLNLRGPGSGTLNINLDTYDVGANPHSAAIKAIDDDYSSHLTFSTKVPGAIGNTLTERLRIQSGGNVGIGTTTPLVRLNVVEDAAYTWPTLGTASGNLFLASTDNLWGMFQGVETGSGGGWIQIMRKDSATAYNLALQPVGGNVGIGTTGPDAPLDVNSTAGPQLRLTYTDGSVYSNFTTDVNGDLNIRASGGDVIIMLG